jgi:chromosome segregation ATPase
VAFAGLLPSTQFNGPRIAPLQANKSWQSKVASGLQHAEQGREAIKSREREIGALEAQLSSCKKQLEQVLHEKSDLNCQLVSTTANLDKQVTVAQEASDIQASSLSAVRSELARLLETVASLETQLVEAQAAARGDAAALEQRAETSEAAVCSLQEAKDAALAEVGSLQQQLEAQLALRQQTEQLQV